MTRAGKLLGGGQTCRTRADNRDALARSSPRKFRLNPTRLEGMVDDLLLDKLDGYGRLINTQHAGRFARRRTDTSRKLREVIGRMQSPQSFTPAVFPNEIVPVRNQIAKWATRMTERHATIHAAACLLLHLLPWKILIHLKPIVDALENRPALRRLAIVFQKSSDFSHRFTLCARLPLFDSALLPATELTSFVRRSRTSIRA